ncbi:CRISPR-associated helicase/endonuclease Cas3 [Thermorudis peleae]|uniref:CRISPR-associated helicase/endonuclease Cas3 n=1 Tax=Thermorudis peleae TaxID=1382356 RepID=UPI00069050AD|nr:CRISPR-associated helicase/endonuclease Cas3 [Thermorudis peleae]
MGLDQLNSAEYWLAGHGEKLIEHLRTVADLSRSYAPPELADLAELAGAVHDLGKATPFFQKRLKDRQYQAPEANHSYISALFGAWVAEQRGLDALAIFLAVARHHGALRSPWELLPSPHDIDPPDFPDVDRPGLRRTLRALTRQLEAVKESWPVLCASLALPDPSPFCVGEIWSTLRRLAEEAARLNYLNLSSLEDFPQRQRYWATNVVFSCLIDADKKLAAGYCPPGREVLPADLVSRYLTGNVSSTGPLQPFRKQVFETVDRHVRSWPLASLYPAQLTLTAPTGAGKTLTALHAALTIRARVEEATGRRLRIIYALPYINLIEQTVDIMHKVLKHAEIEPAHVLLEHHHLAPLNPRPSTATASAQAQQETRLVTDEEDIEVDDALLLAEAWDAEIVFTTFVQVFHTLVGYQNRALKKLHTLVEGSILILDEVQALDAHYWPLLRVLLSDLPRWNVTVILMTATQPRLTEASQARELVDPPLHGYPHRVLIRPAAPRSVPELAEAVAHTRDRSQLVVVNSVRVSLELFRELERYQLPLLFYLSTNITPRDRSVRLAEIRALLKQRQPVVLVSTQVVEAGVDVDFDAGWREWGPLESLLQVAGRINRNANHDLATLELVALAEGQGERVYGRILLDAARESIDGPRRDIELMQLLAEYFARVESRISQAHAESLLAALPRLDYDRANIDCKKRTESIPVSCFRLIEELPSLSIVVEQDEEATRAIANLRQALALDNPNERRLAVRRAYRTLEPYTITPLLHRAVGNLPPPLVYGREDMRLIARNQLESFYDQKTGFKWDLNQFL